MVWTLLRLFGASIVQVKHTRGAQAGGGGGDWGGEAERSLSAATSLRIWMKEQRGSHLLGACRHLRLRDGVWKRETLAGELLRQTPRLSGAGLPFRASIAELLWDYLDFLSASSKLQSISFYPSPLPSVAGGAFVGNPASSCAPVRAGHHEGTCVGSPWPAERGNKGNVRSR